MGLSGRGRRNRVPCADKYIEIRSEGGGSDPTRLVAIYVSICLGGLLSR
jgi:hypothetical protein